MRLSSKLKLNLSLVISLAVFSGMVTKPALAEDNLNKTVITPDESLKPMVINPEVNLKPTITPPDDTLKPIVINPDDTSLKPTVITPEAIPLDGQTDSTVKVTSKEEFEKMQKFVSKYNVDMNGIEQNSYIFDSSFASITFSATTGKRIKVIMNDEEIDNKLIGKTQVDQEKNKTIYTFFGVQIKDGKNTVIAQELNDAGLPVFEYTKDIFVRGIPHSIVIKKAKIPADAKTSGNIEIEVKDKWGNPASDNGLLTVKLDKGLIKAEDKDMVKFGVQVQTNDGKAVIPIVGTTQVESAIIEAEINTITKRDTIEYSTPYREPILVGLAKGRSNYNFITGQSFNNDPAKAGMSYSLGGTVFGQGTIFDDYLLTFAASDRKLNALDDDENVLQRDLAEDRRYPLYGDSSQYNPIVTSNNNFFFKFEKDKSSFLWGDFNTVGTSSDNTAPRLSAYNRVLSGAKLALDIPSITNLEVYGAMTQQAFDKTEVRGAGVTGQYYTNKFPLVNGSERIIIETRDRQLKNKIIKTRFLNRFTDYNIDYANGAITFSEAVSTFDENLNENWIVINSEYYNNSITNNAILGANLRQPLPFLGAFVGASYIKEIAGQNAPNSDPSVANKDYQLYGFNLGNKIGENIELIGEYANSNYENKTGSAYRAAIASKPFDNLSLNGEYQYVEPSFMNRAGTGFSQGNERYSARFNYKPFTSTDFTIDYNRDKILASPSNVSPSTTQATSNNNTTQILNSRLAQELYSNIFSVGLEGRNFADPKKPNSTLYAGLLNLGYKTPTFWGMSLNATREQNILADVDRTRPTATTVGLDYQVLSNLKLFAKQSLLEVIDPNTNKASAGYISAVGIDTGYATDFALLNSMNVGAKYQIDGQIGAREAQNRIGLNNKIGILPGLSVGLNYERVIGQTANVANFSDQYNAYSFSADFAPTWLGLRASGKYDVRDGTRASNLYALNLAGSLGDDFGLFGRYSYADSKDVIRRNNTDARFGVAYRPINSDFFNALFQYNLRGSVSGIGNVSTVTNNIFSLETYFQPSYYWEIFTTFKLKNSFDLTEGKYDGEKITFAPQSSNISLGALRITYKFNYNFDLATEFRIMTNFENFQNTFDFSPELGYYPIKDIRVGVGYNLFGYNDRDLTTSNYMAQGPYVNLALKFDTIGDLWASQGIFTKKTLQ